MGDIDNLNREMEGTSLKDYIKKIRNNLFPVILITIVCIVVATLYALKSVNIFESTTMLKISKPQNSILEANSQEFQSFADDRFISTEIGIMKSRTIRLNVAKALVDSFKINGEKNSFSIILSKSKIFNKNRTLLSAQAIANILGNDVVIRQQSGIDLVNISVKSPSKYEARLAANCYANEYLKYNLKINRKLLTNVKEFLGEQVKDKKKNLIASEDSLSKYQARNGIISLDAQSQALITQLANLEAQRDNKRLDLVTDKSLLSRLKDALKQQNPKIAMYMESMASQPYYQAIQDEIAKLKVTRDLALLNKNTGVNNPIVENYDVKIGRLKVRLDSLMNIAKSAVFSSSPDVVSGLLGKIMDTNLQTHIATLQLSELNRIINKYDTKFNRMPATSIKYARLERNTEADQNLVSLLEEKYQEAQINELSQPGNVIIIDPGNVPNRPVEPNRPRIILIGLLIGLGLSFGFVMVKEYFSNTIKTPEDLEEKNINVLSWIPNIEGIDKNGHRGFEFIVSQKPDSIPSEAFKALRQRIQYSKVGDEPLKTILVTSSAPGEGKTIVSVNLAGSFAQLGKKTLLIDTDLRRPRIHNIFDVSKHPGISEFLFDKAPLEEIIRSTGIENMSYITVGTMSPNPSELLASKKMSDFIRLLKNKFDIIILDSAPMLAVIDSETLSTMVDATILVVSADKTEYEAMSKATGLLKKGSNSFIGAVLNNFTYKSGYGSYYKYYYYYNSPKTKKKKKDVVSKS